MIQQYNSLLKALCNHIPDALGLIDADEFRILFMNQAAVQLFHLSTGQPVEHLLEQELNFTSTEVQEVKTKLVNKIAFKKNLQLVQLTNRWVELVIEPVEDLSNVALFRIVDLSESVQTEETLLKEIQKFEALFNYASLGIILVNQKGEITLSNPYANKQFEYNSGELIGKTIEELIPQRYQNTHVGHRERYHKKPEVRTMGKDLELFAKTKTGKEFPVQISLGHFANEEGKFTLAYIVDDTDRKAFEKEIIRQQEETTVVNEKMKQLNELLEFKVAERTQMLQETLKELEQSRDILKVSLEKEKQLNDMKSRFVSMASHEFRTPLSTILSSITLLSKYISSEDQPKREKHIDRIKASVTTLTDILNEFLSLGRIEDGKIEPKWTEFSLPELVRSVLRQLEPLQSSGQTIRHLHSGVEQIVLDPGLLKNIFINLINNAIKFSPSGSEVTVTTTIEKEDVIISIQDKGLGISEEDQQHLFERFFRGANVTNIQGTGLGLHIVSRYVQLMNGSISCNSVLEEGTEFIIRLKQHKFDY